MPRHADEQKLSEKVGATVRTMKELGILTDTNVAASNTVAALQTAITTATNGATNHAEVKPMLTGFLSAIDTGAAIGDFTDAKLAPLTSVDGLIALTASTNDANRDNFLV